MQGVTDSQPYVVVADTEGHVSVWPAAREVPPGWRGTGVGGAREECLARIEQAWRDEPRPAGTAGAETVGAGTAEAETLVTLFRRVAAARPDAPAVGAGDRVLTYAELDAASDALARDLLGRGVRVEDRVAVQLDRGIEVFAAILGILKAGGAYVVIDTRYPDGRRDAMVADSGARVVVTGPGRAGSFPGLEVLELDRVEPDGERGDGPGGELPMIAPGTAACVLFTSGSSGRPKGIVLEHRNLVHFATNGGLPELRPTDRMGHASSLSFDAFHYETWCGFAAGAHLVVLPTVRELVETDVQRELRRHRITTMLVPTMAVNQVVHEDMDAFASLRVLCTGGDVVLPSVCRTLLEGGFAGEFVNLYGPTEGTTACTAYDIRQLGEEADTVPIGRPLPGTVVHVLAEDLTEVPDGEIGEMYLGGAGVARGYLGQPGLTANSFRPDPYTPGGGRMYATGDRARRRADGVLEFVGRADDQVKIRGYRVEPREVERLLSRHPGLREVAVLAAGDGSNRHLIALVVPYDQLSPKEIREYAGERMPEFMVPSSLVRVEEIPVNDHGKRDLDQLRALVAEQARRGEQRVRPRDDVERYLAELWEELLTVEQIGAADDFFALGGNSLLAFRVQQRIKRELQVPLAPKEILANSRLDGLADIIRERKAANA